MDLDAQDASEVLAHDELPIGHPGRESQVLTWFKELVAYKIERYARARKVWEAVRFELLSVQELLSFQEDINSNKLWAEVRQELGEFFEQLWIVSWQTIQRKGRRLKRQTKGECALQRLRLLLFTIPSRISCPYQPQQHGKKGL